MQALTRTKYESTVRRSQAKVFTAEAAVAEAGVVIRNGHSGLDPIALQLVHFIRRKSGHLFLWQRLA